MAKAKKEDDLDVLYDAAYSAGYGKGYVDGYSEGLEDYKTLSECYPTRTPDGIYNQAIDDVHIEITKLGAESYKQIIDLLETLRKA